MSRLLRMAAISSLVAASASISSCSSLDVSTPTAVSIEQTTFATSLGVNLAASTKTPNGVYYRDITVGTGPVIANGQALTVRYTGWLSNGSQFDSNTTTAGFPFTLGVSNVIPGWHEGLQGARVGTTRQLIVPPALAYGSGNYGPIPGNSVIVFNVEVVTAQ